MSQDREIGVIFDVDGVLVDSYAAHLESWKRLGAELGRDLTEAQFASTFGRTSRDIIAELFGETDPARIGRLDERKEQFYRDSIRGRVPVMPGAVELVESCRRAGLRLGVGSSGPPENVQLVCDAMDLTRRLSAIVTGRDVTRGKPDPQVFLLAAKQMAIAADRCVVVEDAPAGIEAARRAGMKSIALTSTHPAEAFDGADLIVASLSGLDADRIIELSRPQ